MVDVISMGTNAWLSLNNNEHSEADLTNFQFTAPTWVGHEIEIVVPKKAVEKSAFTLVSVLPYSFWAALIAMFVSYSAFDRIFSRKKIVKYCYQSFSKAAFRYFQITLSQGFGKIIKQLY